MQKRKKLYSFTVKIKYLLPLMNIKNMKQGQAMLLCIINKIITVPCVEYLTKEKYYHINQVHISLY